MPKIRIASLQAVFGADDSQLTAVAKRVEATMRGVDGRLRDAQGRFAAVGKASHEMGDGIKAGTAKGAAGANVLAGVAGKLKMIFAALGVAEAMKQVVEFGNKTADVASDVNEAITKNQVLFGAHAKAIEEWSRTTSTALGISRKAALEASGDYGNLFRGMGFGEEKAAQFSKSLVTIASDMASFNNKPVEQAMDALRSGLVGEQEPLRAFGVNLNETVMKAEAVRMGLGKVTGTLSPQQKALAALSLIYKQTSLAQGDFARTADGAANQGRTLAGRIVDMEEKIGRFSLTIKTKAQVALLGLFDAIDRVNWAGIGEQASKASKQVSDAFAKSDFARFFVAQWQKIVSFFQSNGQLFAAGIENVLKNVSALWDRYGGYIWSAVNVVWDAIKKTIALVLDTILGRVKIFWQVLAGDWRGALKTFGQMNAQALAYIWDLLLNTLRLIGWFARASISALADTYKKVRDYVIALFSDLGNQIGMRLGIALENAFGKVAEPVARKIWQLSQMLGKTAGVAAGAMLPGSGVAALDRALPQVAAPKMPAPPNFKMPRFTLPKLAPVVVADPKSQLDGVKPTDLIAGKNQEAEKAGKDLASFAERLSQTLQKLRLIKKGVAAELADFIVSNRNVPEASARRLYALEQEIKGRADLLAKSLEETRALKTLHAEIDDLHASNKAGRLVTDATDALEAAGHSAEWIANTKIKKAQAALNDFAKRMAEIRQQIKEQQLVFLNGGRELTDSEKFEAARGIKHTDVFAMPEDQYKKELALKKERDTVLSLNAADDQARKRQLELKTALAEVTEGTKKQTAVGKLYAELLTGEWKNASVGLVAQLKETAVALDAKTAATLRAKEIEEASAPAFQMIADLQARIAEAKTGRADTEASFGALAKLFEKMGVWGAFAAAAVLNLRQELKQLTEAQKKQSKAEADARAVASTIGRSVRGIWEDLLSGNAGLLKRFARRISDALTDSIGVAIERAVTKGITEKLTKALMDGISPALKKLVEGVREAASAADASAQALLSGAFSILSVLGRKKKSGFGSILGGLAGALMPGGGLLAGLAGYNIGNAVDNGDVLGAVLAGANFKAASGIGQGGSWSGLKSGGRSVVVNQVNNLINNAPINGLSGVEQISGVMGRNAERKIAFVGG